MWDDRSSRIDHEGPVVLWEQVRDDLLALIDARDLSPGAKLPGEIELGELYGVSRVTVRRAVGELRKSGRLVMVTGKGTFVPRAT